MRQLVTRSMSGGGKKDESVAVAVRRVILVFVVGRIVIVVAVTGRSAAVNIAPISIESELETTLNTFVITVLKLAVGTVIFRLCRIRHLEISRIEYHDCHYDPMHRRCTIVSRSIMVRVEESTNP